MSKIALEPNASGTGTFSIASPNSNSNRTLTLPDASGTLARTADIPSVNPFTLGTAVASTSGTAIDFTGIPSWAKRVTVMFRDVSFAADPVAVGFRLGTSSGIDTTSDYTRWRGFFSTTGASADLETSNNAIYTYNGSGHTGSTTYSGVVTFVNLSGNSWNVSGTMGIASPTQLYQLLGVKTLSGTLDRVRVFCFSSSFDAGTINISYEG